jgi:predicted ATPase
MVVAISASKIWTIVGSLTHYLSLLLPELTTTESQYPAPTYLPQLDKLHLFRALVHLWIGLTNEKPVVVVLEDLHWCDDVSLEFLLHLARDIPNHPLLLLMSYRHHEIQPQLNNLLTRLEREQFVTEFTLQHLSPTATETMLKAILGQEFTFPPKFLRAFYHLTDGNPLFIEEILKSLITDGIISDNGIESLNLLDDVRIPHSLQRAVHQRTHKLSPRAKLLLALAAVSGREFDLRLMLALEDWSENVPAKILMD